MVSIKSKLGAGVLAVALLTGISVPLVAQDGRVPNPKANPDPNPAPALRASSETARAAIDACMDCYKVCQETITYCTEKGGKYVEGAHLLLLIDCGELCKTCADCMIHKNESQAQICATTAEVCARAAASCEQFPGDPKMRACAEALRACAESCRRMDPNQNQSTPPARNN